ncbi:23S rRNA (adenine(2503)-C(2))-methyltransferase RlmN [Entomospira entomophila]|uniref:23S rRNA (Adenine(2503)-C(2))-methyltransferase RlmN n=1 Tax=Entomospira entomophila TaxID=2719988 RepID=A0A968KTW9_9SPIO|nr:23S rRNA (adenine(2503)-C(2))-methyltransferase RlmN [Entomospira entomophilus]NIZ40801.1 23S rRNA (adenine(2503)-C(2))-methyltransferase RlmN [Entomospira entomophilus]WDI35013.1 23S rRNA (adenine(2503)-C(2))-methyltransferase RlmN [Entomospira entomophilus]
MKNYQIDPLQYTYEEVITLFDKQYNKGEYHAKAFWNHLHRAGSTDVSQLKEFQQNATLAQKIATDFPLTLPEASFVEEVDGNIKFRLNLGQNHFTESVVIAMKTYKSLCVSSQVGCARACQFCATGQLGLKRNLLAQEILAQYHYARFILKQPIKNIVFMGMGEPMDNFDAVIRSIQIFADQRGIRIPTKFITISTVGDVAGLYKLKNLMDADIEQESQRASGITAPICYRSIKVAVSLHAANNTLRDELMPTNRKWPLESLKQVLQEMPIKRKDHDLFIEYTLIPNINDDAQALARYLEDLPCVVNLIAYNPVPNLTFQRPSEEQIIQFKKELENHGIVVRYRRSRADDILGACGQLGSTSV